MAYYKVVDNGYISAIRISDAVDDGMSEITQTEYATIADIIQNRPKETDNEKYRLTENLTWESYEPKDDVIEDTVTANEIEAALEDIL